jgi:tRNA A64-2'-O-ribosylphosphate transferase
LSVKVTKPLQPIFITPESDLNVVLSREYFLVILLTASTSVTRGHQRVGGFVYVQGAADDEESWAQGLTSRQFWENNNTLLKCTTEDELTSLIEDITKRALPRELSEESTVIRPSNIALGLGQTVESCPTIICRSESVPCRQNKEVLWINIPAKSKAVHVIVHEILPTIVSFALHHKILHSSPISIKAADSSQETVDLSIAVTLVILCLYFNDKGLSIFGKGG